MFSTEEIYHDKLFEIFINERNITVRTIRGHAQAIKLYSNYNKMLPEKLITEAEEEQDRGVKTYRKKINGRIKGFIDYMKAEDYSPFSIKSYLNSIKAFYHHFDIITPRLRGNWKTKGKERNLSHDKLPTKEDIKRLMDVKDVRDQALILLHLSSGMGASEVRNLTWRNFLEAYENYYKPPPDRELDIPHIVYKLTKIDEKEKENKLGGIIGTWKISRVKTGMNYITFNTPESGKYILKYLKHRYNINKPIKNIEDPLFVSYFNQKITHCGYTGVFQRLNEKAGFERRSKTTTKHRQGRHFITSHVLRKTFTTILYGSGWDKLRVDWLLGHKVDDVSSAYFKIRPDVLLEDYRKSIGELSITENFEYCEVTDKDYQMAIERIEELEKHRDDYREAQQLIDELLTYKNVLEELKKRR
ncbi:tyrosine-type recombinase/integrase [Methanobacterium formicicum]|uniref:Tyrosine-type recombinase/integrase n=1 Tax=Methanobacterium formicicum TaxID=2162 RepID=A0A843AKS5_METFO|nr:tyrosine-type recombinase/integrase [Methanobacterium formicicum]MBF4473911.1 tyrosine-type recombinase/integrase [Methanobacterium formicicum]